MKILSRLLLTLAVTWMLAGCSGGKSFRIEGVVAGLGAEEVQALYMTPRGVQRVAARADREGRFSIKGSSDDCVLVEITRADGTALARVPVANGQTIRMETSLKKPWQLRMEGAPVAEALSEFYAANAGMLGNPARRAALDRAVGAYIGEHRGLMSSTVLLVTLFDARENPREADSLLNLIEPQARPGSLTAVFKTLLSQSADPSSQQGTSVNLVGPFTVYGSNDSLVGFVPSGRAYSLLAFTAAAKPDSVRKLLASLRHDYPRRRLEVMELAMWGDSAAWRRTIRGDSARWTQAWIPGGPATTAVRRLAVPRTPFFIVVDSLGRQSLRTSSTSAVVRFIKSSPALGRQ